MSFSKEDFFNKDVITRLSVLMNIKMNLPYNTSFNSLPKRKQKEYNQFLNDYIKSLGEDWREVLEKEFNEVVLDEILNDKFEASNQFIPQLNTKREMLLNDEQKKWYSEISQQEKEWFEN